jgi:predicted ester cyclase
MTAEEHKALVRRYVTDVMTNGYTAAIDELFAPDVIDSSPIPAEPLGMDDEGALIGLYAGLITDISTPGREGLRYRTLRLRTAFPDARMTIDDMQAIGDDVTFRLTLRGTHSGPLGNAAATGKAVSLTGTDIVRFRDSKIVEHTSQIDSSDAAEQLGIAAPSGAAEGHRARG